MIGASTVIPDFVRRLTSDPQIIGLSGSLWAFFWLFPQLFMAQTINRMEKRSIILQRYTVPLRLFFVVLAVIMFLTDDSRIILVAFLIAYSLFAIGDALLTIAWADLLGSTLPKRARSTLYMVGQLGVTIVVLGSRGLVQKLLGADGPPFPHNFAYLFGVCGIIFLIAGVFLSRVKDEKASATYSLGPTMREYLPFLGSIWRTDKHFRHFIRTRACFDLATMAIPFYIVFGVNVLKLNSANAVGDSIITLTLGNAIGSLVFGTLSHRYGSRAVIRWAGLGIVLHPLLALSSVLLGAPTWYAAFFVLGIVGSSNSPGYFDWIITYAPEHRRPIYMGLTNTISALSSLAPALGGVVLSILLGLLGSPAAYAALFLLASGLALFGLISSFGLVEPRTHSGHNTPMELPPTPELVEIG